MWDWTTREKKTIINNATRESSVSGVLPSPIARQTSLLLDGSTIDDIALDPALLISTQMEKLKKLSLVRRVVTLPLNATVVKIRCEQVNNGLLKSGVFASGPCGHTQCANCMTKWSDHDPSIEDELGEHTVRTLDLCPICCTRIRFKDLVYTIVEDQVT
ncbi:unnamed protein product [Allacma fusca]|uniref:Uncharacterized protein n=1 Tax=Allacma fusca TaxID=39272 RepID=A0A8J2JR42_9HEXA|nr:unnamed protein product [Allacma fusca]